jgi:D-alanyl-D-alanine carboxypeptidase (penicillin-binding protein 5/6)
MIRRRWRWLLVCSGLVWACVAQAQRWPQPPEVAARAYALIDVSSDQELAMREADQPVPPASLTKLMTAYLAFDAVRVGRVSLDDSFAVSELAQQQPGSRMFVEAGWRVPVNELVKGLLVQSGNDAAVALAEGLAGSVDRFVEQMNEQARVLGMKSTRFVNPTGLPAAGQQTTARDLSMLALRLLRDFPDRAHFFAIRKYRYEGTPPANDTNRNVLLFRDPSVEGMKTGHTDAAGFCLIATARRDFPKLGPDGAPGPRRLLLVLMGADSEQARASEGQKLLNWGYTAFDVVKLFDANQPVLTPAVWKGRSAQARLGQAKPIIVAVPRGEAARLKFDAVRPDPLVAPLRKGQAVGTLRIYISERMLIQKPLYALESVDEAGLLGRAWDAFRLWIQ